jgi:hypothetical protein
MRLYQRTDELAVRRATRLVLRPRPLQPAPAANVSWPRRPKLGALHSATVSTHINCATSILNSLDDAIATVGTATATWRHRVRRHAAVGMPSQSPTLTSPRDTPRFCQSSQACLVNLSCTSTTTSPALCPCRVCWSRCCCRGGPLHPRTPHSAAVASHPRCHILIRDVMCLSYMTSVVRLGGSARTAKTIYSVVSAPLGRRLTFAPRNFWSCSATTSGWSMTTRWLASSTRLSRSSQAC